MDTAKPSISSKASHVNNGEGSGADQDEAADQWEDTWDWEWHKYPETTETDFVDGVPFTAAPLDVHRGSADVKHKFHSMGYRRTKQKVMGDFGTVTKGISGATKPRTALKQVLFSQGASDKNPTPEDQLQMEALKQALEAYPVPADLRWAWEEPSQGTTLENSWTDIVDSHSNMSKSQRHQQEALWEFVHTELAYINKLTIVNDLVIAALVNLQQHGFLLEIKPGSLFSNLPVVLNAHRQFWQEVIFPMLQNTRRTGRPFDPRSLEAGCLQFSERFDSYLPYCLEQENTVEFARKQMHTNPNFLVYLEWVETHPLCNRMRLGDMQAKPHQRITKYPLLLKAVLKYTQDPHIQQTIRGMLSSVNTFLKNINDNLRHMVEELALSVSAQRVDGYEVPGVNEEIDKHLQEICHFDLTTPVVGVGPRIVRKLLLEENLKIRGRKENKLEVVVALLFSDVLLVTKVQKKVERLRVVFPPLALEKTCCVALKDGYSFLLVEVSELGCANNVYIFVTATAESCSTWVSTIHQAKDTLKTLREDETSRQLDRQRIQQLDSSPLVPAIQPSNLSSDSSAETPTPEIKITGPHSRSMYSSFPSKQQEHKSPEGIEMQVKRHKVEVEVEFTGSKERRVTWNHNKSSVSTNVCPQNNADNLRSKPKEGQKLFMGEYPEVDYLTDELVSPPKDLQLSNSSNSMEEFPSLPVGGPMKVGYRIHLADHKIWKDPCKSLSTEDEAVFEGGGFSRKLNSPKLRRRRPNNSQHGDTTHTHGLALLGGPENVWLTPHTNSLSNSDSDSNQKLEGNFDPSHTNSDASHRVLKLGSLKTNSGMFWNIHENRASLEPFPELPQEIPGEWKTRKSQRSASVPDLHELHGNSTSEAPRTDMELSPRFTHRQRAHLSPVEGLLERAKVRVRREGGQIGSNGKMQDTRTWHLPPSATSFSEALGDGDREVKLMRHRVPTVSQGWREQLVDGDAEDKKYSHFFVDELNVDWPGWCFDDEEVMDYLGPTDLSNGDTGMLDDINKTLITWNITRPPDAKISQV